MGTYYVEEHDIHVIRLRQGTVEHTLEREPCILVDVDAEGKPMTIEIVAASTTTPQQLTEFGIELRVADKVA